MPRRGAASLFNTRPSSILVRESRFGGTARRPRRQTRTNDGENPIALAFASSSSTPQELLRGPRETSAPSRTKAADSPSAYLKSHRFHSAGRSHRRSSSASVLRQHLKSAGGKLVAQWEATTAILREGKGIFATLSQSSPRPANSNLILGAGHSTTVIDEDTIPQFSSRLGLQEDNRSRRSSVRTLHHSTSTSRVNPFETTSSFDIDTPSGPNTGVLSTIEGSEGDFFNFESPLHGGGIDPLVDAVYRPAPSILPDRQYFRESLLPGLPPLPQRQKIEWVVASESSSNTRPLRSASQSSQKDTTASSKRTLRCDPRRNLCTTRHCCTSMTLIPKIKAVDSVGTLFEGGASLKPVPLSPRTTLGTLAGDTGDDTDGNYDGTESSESPQPSHAASLVPPLPPPSMITTPRSRRSSVMTTARKVQFGESEIDDGAWADTHSSKTVSAREIVVPSEPPSPIPDEESPEQPVATIPEDEHEEIGLHGIKVISLCPWSPVRGTPIVRDSEQAELRQLEWSVQMAAMLDNDRTHEIAAALLLQDAEDRPHRRGQMQSLLSELEPQSPRRRKKGENRYSSRQRARSRLRVDRQLRMISTTICGQRRIRSETLHITRIRNQAELVLGSMGWSKLISGIQVWACFGLSSTSRFQPHTFYLDENGVFLLSRADQPGRPFPLEFIFQIDYGPNVPLIINRFLRSGHGERRASRGRSEMQSIFRPFETFKNHASRGTNTTGFNVSASAVINLSHSDLAPPDLVPARAPDLVQPSELWQESRFHRTEFPKNNRLHVVAEEPHLENREQTKDDFDLTHHDAFESRRSSETRSNHHTTGRVPRSSQLLFSTAILVWSSNSNDALVCCSNSPQVLQLLIECIRFLQFHASLKPATLRLHLDPSTLSSTSGQPNL